MSTPPRFPHRGVGPSRAPDLLGKAAPIHNEKGGAAFCVPHAHGRAVGEKTGHATSEASERLRPSLGQLVRRGSVKWESASVSSVKMNFVMSSSWSVLLVAALPLTAPVFVSPRIRPAYAPTTAARARPARVCDALDDSEASDELNVPRGFGGGPRGFGGGGAALDNIRDWAEETEAYAGAMLPAELRARRDKILLKWANFVQTAGSRAPPSPPIAALRNVSLRFGDEMVLREVSWELCEGQIIGVVGESGCGKSTQLRLLAEEATPVLATAAAAGLATAGGGLAADRARELTGEVWVAPDVACALEYVPQGVLASLALERSLLGDYVRKAVGKSVEAADGALAAAEVEAVAAEEAVWAWLGWINVPVAEASDDEDEDEDDEDEDDEEEDDEEEDEEEEDEDEDEDEEEASVVVDEASSSSTTTAAFGSVAAFTAAAAVGRALFGDDAAPRPPCPACKCSPRRAPSLPHR